MTCDYNVFVAEDSRYRQITKSFWEYVLYIKFSNIIELLNSSEYAYTYTLRVNLVNLNNYKKESFFFVKKNTVLPHHLQRLNENCAP